jgi:hypothetical protein
MILAATRPLAAAAALLCLGLLAPSAAPAATGPAPTHLETAIIRTALVPEPGVDYTRWAAWTLAGGAAATPDAGPDKRPVLAIPAGGSASQTLLVPRGGVSGKGRRYLVTTRIMREGAAGSASLTVSSSGGSSTGTAGTTGVWETVVRERGRLQQGWDAARRKWITGFALDHGLARPVTADVPCVEAVLYRHPREDIVMLINYVGDEPLPAVNLTVQGTAKVRAVESLRHGPLTFEQTASGVRFALPLAQGDAVRLLRE